APAYYKVDSTRVSFREYWQWKPGLPFLILALRKILGWRLPAHVFVAAQPRVLRVDGDGGLPGLRALLQPAIGAVPRRGGRLLFLSQAPTRGSFRGLGAALLGPDGAYVALAPAAEGPRGQARHAFLGLASRVSGGRILATGQGNSFFPSPRGVD